ncbi:hypothetical protein D3C71_2067900 [compost metagenome]
MALRKEKRSVRSLMSAALAWPARPRARMAALLSTAMWFNFMMSLSMLELDSGVSSPEVLRKLNGQTRRPAR